MKVLMVLTSHGQLGDTGQKTGFWLEELAALHYAFGDAGAEVVLASPKGGRPPLDLKSNGAAYQTNLTCRFEADGQAMQLLDTTVRLGGVSHDGYDAVFYPGGYGPLWDLANDKNSIKLIESFLNSGKPVALVCYARGVSRRAKKPNGRSLAEGQRVTGFTNSEEEAMGLTKVVPFLVDDELKANGAFFSKAANWAPYVVTDGPLVTGQNPASGPAARPLLEQIAKGGNSGGLTCGCGA